MPSTCSFLYDRPNNVYYSGEVLNGKIVLTTDSVKKVRGVYLTIRGVAKVHWSEQKSRHNHHTNKQEHYVVDYKGEQNYLNSRTLVEGDIDLPPGTHEYTFTAPLPVQLPSSFADVYGQISYEVELKLDRPMRPDNVYTNCFTVIRPLNLNLDPSYMQSIVDEEQKYFCCFCCESGPVNSELRTEFAGCAPGQKINFTVTIDNEANKDIDECTVQLIQAVAFQSDTPEHKTKNLENVIGSVELEGAKRFSKKLRHGSIEVPPLPPTTMGPDDIISLSYYLKAEIETGFCSTNEDLTAIITIGTVPLVASATNPHSVITTQPTAPMEELTGDDKPPAYGSIVPPSFEEATGMNKPFIDTDVDVDDNRVVDPFLPKYPVYRNFVTPSVSDGVTKGSQQTPSVPESSSTTPTVQPSAPALFLQPMALPYPLDNISLMPVPGRAMPVQNSSASDVNDGGPSLGWRS